MKFVKSILIVVLVAMSSASFAQQKFGVISSQEILMKMPEMDSIQNQLEQIRVALVADMEATDKEYQAKVQEYQKNQATYSDIMREQKEKDIQSLMTRMQQFQQTAQTELSQQQQRLLAPVQEKVMNAITKVGKDNSFLFIFEKQAQLYVSETLVTDVTALVMTELGIK